MAGAITAHSRRPELYADVHDKVQVVAADLQARNEKQRDRALAMTVASNALFLNQYEKVLAKVMPAIPSPTYTPKPRGVSKERVLNLLLSDLHFHALLDPGEVPLRYGPLEEARRLAAIVVQAAEYKRQYRKETSLHVHLLGDIIQGQLHDLRDGAPLAAQCGAAIFLLAQAIRFLASEFPNGVTVSCTPGNHGRNMHRHPKRAVNQKWDSIEGVIYLALKQALMGVPNVTFQLGREPYYTVNLFNKRAFFTHGDTVLDPGYPGKSINVGGIENQVNRINAAEADEGRPVFDLFAVGHVHIGTMTHLPAGAVFLSNGPLIPPDAFAVSQGIFSTRCGQWLWESVTDHVVGDSRFCLVDKSTDRDKDLDKIITPFKGF